MAQKKAPDGAKVFLLSGGQRQHHGYRDQAFYLAERLENTGRFEVTIGEDAAILETPAMRKYDLIIVNADRRDPEFKFTTSQQEALFDFVRSGHGYVSIHGADNAAPDWLPEWKEMLGGIYSHVGLPDGKTARGASPSRSPTPPARSPGASRISPSRTSCTTNMQMLPGRPAAGHDRVSGRRLARGLDPHLRQGPGLPHDARPPRLRARIRTTRVRNPNLSRLIVQGVDWVAERPLPDARSPDRSHGLATSHRARFQSEAKRFDRCREPQACQPALAGSSTADPCVGRSGHDRRAWR